MNSDIKVSIHKAGIEHLERIVEIYNQAIIDGFCTADMDTYHTGEKLQWFSAHDEMHPIFVALHDEEVIGWISLSAYRPGRKAFRAVREVSGYLDKNFRGLGIGTQVMNFIIDLAPSLGIKHLLGILLSKNRRSIALVEKSGFEKWASLPELADFDGIKCDHLYYGKKIG